jgi:single-stranded-DNA-specific exonuclease
MMEKMTRRRWVQRGENEDGGGAESLGRALNISSLVARTLFFRDIKSAEEGRNFLDPRLSSLPDPFLLAGMAEAVDRLVLAIERAEPIAVHGDYDVDGITGTALLVETLCAFGGIAEYFIPLRLIDGYGLSSEALKRAAASGIKVVLSVDCGVSAVEEARLASELGLDLIITDHHHPPENLPAVLALVNPHQPGCRFPFHELAGVGVAFFLLGALRKALRERGAFASREEPDLRMGLDLVALGTIADIVPLKGINRSLVKTGLSVLNSGQRPGIRALKKVAAVEEVNCGAVGFRLAPRLNAAGRLEDAGKGVDLLLDPSTESALETARLLDGFNRERQRIEQETLAQALEKLEEKEEDLKSIVLADERWHPGVIGIVASRLVERYQRPTVLIALENGEGKGSARSIGGFHLFRALQACRGHLAGFGGHEFAAGLTVEAAKVESFVSSFEEVAKTWLNEEDLIPKLAYDGEVLLEELSLETVRELSSLAPFGPGNPEPAFVAAGLRAQQIRPVGDDHLRFTIRQGGYSLPCIAFGMASRRPELEGEVDLLFSPGVNAWRGRESVQLRVRDIRKTKEG